MIVAPHKKISREVEEKDFERIEKDAQELVNLCSNIVPAMSHPQIDDTDPLNFFVFRTGEVVINPRIVKQTYPNKDSTEGCLTFPEKKPITVQRSWKCTIKYQLLVRKDGKLELTKPFEQEVKGILGYVFQHEIDHLNAKYIYE